MSWNWFVESLKFDERKVLYITQTSVHPPSFVLFTDKKRGRCIFRTNGI